MPADELRPRQAIETVLAWANGSSISTHDIRVAADAAIDAAYAIDTAYAAIDALACADLQGESRAGCGELSPGTSGLRLTPTIRRPRLT